MFPDTSPAAHELHQAPNSLRPETPCRIKFIRLHDGSLPAVIVDGEMTRDGGQPASERAVLSKAGQPLNRLQENILHQVFRVTECVVREQYAVHHSSISLVQRPESRTIALSGGTHQHGIGGFGRCSHGFRIYFVRSAASGALPSGLPVWGRRLR